MEYKSSTQCCLVCRRKGVDLHHIKTRKSGGCDSVWNLMPLCRTHHQLVHQIGLMKLSQCEAVRQFLINNGWGVCELRNKWIRQN